MGGPLRGTEGGRSNIKNIVHYGKGGTKRDRRRSPFVSERRYEWLVNREGTAKNGKGGAKSLIRPEKSELRKH